MNNDKLNEIVKRLHGDFFVSCVGPVRSGKSTFINKFMNLKILPYITDDYLKNKILDELPQTSAGKQIMTVEPKFVPSEAINVNIGDINMNFKDQIQQIFGTTDIHELKQISRDADNTKCFRVSK